MVAATNKNLKNKVKNKTFRDDLFHRLNFSTILEPEGNRLTQEGSAFETVGPDGILSVDDLRLLEREKMKRMKINKPDK